MTDMMMKPSITHGSRNVPLASTSYTRDRVTMTIATDVRSTLKMGTVSMPQLIIVPDDWAELYSTALARTESSDQTFISAETVLELLDAADAK